MWRKFFILSLCIAIIGGPVTARGEVATAGGDVTTERELACKCSIGAHNCMPKGRVHCVPAANGPAFYRKCQWKDGRCQLKVHEEDSCYKKECTPNSCKMHSVEVESAVSCNTFARREEDCKATKTKKLSWPCQAGGPAPVRAGYKIITNTCEGTEPDSNQPKDQACPEGGCLVQKLEGDCAVDNGECKPVGDPVEEKCRAVPIIRIQVGEPSPNNGNFACQEGSLCPDGSKMQPHPSDPNSACCEADGSLVCCARLIS
jgi:hypothetical protein